jgi:hypothetical protein
MEDYYYIYKAENRSKAHGSNCDNLSFVDRFDNIKANKSRLITAGLGLITRPTANMKNITKSILLFEKILVRIFTCPS